MLGSTGCQPVLFWERSIAHLATTHGMSSAGCRRLQAGSLRSPEECSPETKDLAGPAELAYVQGLTSYVVGI
jgi:hypothetical protein